jgi:hypothetical protein
MPPQRIQRRRSAGWTMPEGAVYVGRPGRWGNPFPYRQDWGLVRTFPDNPGVIEYESRISADGASHNMHMPGGEIIRCNVRYATRAELVELYRRTLLNPDRGMLMGYPSRHGHYAKVTVEEIRAELAGKDLACWCSLDQPCHADVLLDIANASERSVSKVNSAEG